MSSEFVIDRAKTADIDAIVDIETLCFSKDKFSKRQLLYLINKACGACLVMRRNNGAVVAYASLLKRSTTHNLRIYSIAVHPQEQHQHIGQQLMEYIIGYGRQQKFREITLEVSVNNKSAINLYQKNGFKTIGIIENYYHDGSNAFRMLRSLK